jgi:hypothetical protein
LPAKADIRGRQTGFDPSPTNSAPIINRCTVSMRWPLWSICVSLRDDAIIDARHIRAAFHLAAGYASDWMALIKDGATLAGNSGPWTTFPVLRRFWMRSVGPAAHSAYAIRVTRIRSSDVMSNSMYWLPRESVPLSIMPSKVLAGA